MKSYGDLPGKSGNASPYPSSIITLLDAITSYIRKNKIVTETTLQRLRNGDNITTDAICKFCALLNCQPGDILEYIPDNENG